MRNEVNNRSQYKKLLAPFHAGKYAATKVVIRKLPNKQFCYMFSVKLYSFRFEVNNRRSLLNEICFISEQI